jgi:hypothetical protein
MLFIYQRKGESVQSPVTGLHESRFDAVMRAEGCGAGAQRVISLTPDADPAPFSFKEALTARSKAF